MATEVYHKPRKKYGNSNPNLIMTRVAVENKLLKRKDYKYIQIFATTFMEVLNAYYHLDILKHIPRQFNGNTFPKSRVQIK